VTAFNFGPEPKVARLRAASRARMITSAMNVRRTHLLDKICRFFTIGRVGGERRISMCQETLAFPSRERSIEGRVWNS
jgi:hypothetical protein